MAGQLADQYAKQKAAGLSYPNEEELPKFFRAQAAKLAANGVTSIYDVGTQERETEKIIDYYEDGSPIYGPSTEQFLINKQTGQDIRDVVLKPTWEKDPEAYRFRKPATLETTRAGFTRWGKDLSVEGQGDYGLNFVDGVPVYTPFWKDTATDPGAIIIAGALLGAGLYQLYGAGAAAGAAYNPMAGAEFAFAPEAAGATGISLLETTQLPPTAPGMGGGTGLTQGATTGFQASAIPPAAGMGGAQGLTVPVTGGTVTASGLIPTGATVPLGGGGSGVLDTLRTINSVRNMLTQPTVQQQAGLLGGGGGQARGVDFSPLYQNTVVGLLPLAERYRRSLI